MCVCMGVGCVNIFAFSMFAYVAPGRNKLLVTSVRIQPELLLFCFCFARFARYS